LVAFSETTVFAMKSRCYAASSRPFGLPILATALALAAVSCGGGYSNGGGGAGYPSTISGTITPTAGGSGATVTLSGAAAATTTTDGSGNYAFSGLANGTYMVTPTNCGYSFTPVSQNVTVNGANQTSVNFTATPLQTHTVALTWVASTTTTVNGYNVYRSTINGSGYAKIASLGLVFAYIDTNVQNCSTYYYVTTAVDSTGVESGYSNQATAPIP
jgi:carboxypeptidase family protein